MDIKKELQISDEDRAKFYSKLGRKEYKGIKGPTNLPIGDELFEIYDNTYASTFSAMVIAYNNYEEVKKQVDNREHHLNFSMCYDVVKLFTKEQLEKELEKIKEYEKVRGLIK